jgi:DNA-binding transcriptional regulator GbsR (MarR family)
MADAEKRMTKALHQTYKAYNKLNEETKYSPILEASSDDAKDLKKLHDGILSAYESAQMWTKTLENCQTRRGLLKIVSDPGMDSYTKVQEVLGFASEISQRR